MYKVTLYVLGVCCLESIELLEKEIRERCGIVSFKSYLPKGKMVVEFKPSLVSSMEIINDIEKHGFAVVKKVQKEYGLQTFH